MRTQLDRPRSGAVPTADGSSPPNTRPIPTRRATRPTRRKRLVVGSPSHLREIDHWVFGAARPPLAPLRALVAGGGTGDGAIMLAQQMARAGRPGRVTYLDRSAAAAASRAAGRRRAGCTLDWHEGSLLDLPASGSARSTTSTAAACCTTCRTRRPGCARCCRCWRPAAGWA